MPPSDRWGLIEAGIAAAPLIAGAFSLRDERGAAVPVLGSQQNGELALAALLHTASMAVGVRTEELESVAAELRQVVFAPPEDPREALRWFLRRGVGDGSAWSRIAADASCRALLDVLWSNYVLFAALTPDGVARRILKYEYTEDLGPREATSVRERLSVDDVLYRVWHPALPVRGGRRASMPRC